LDIFRAADLVALCRAALRSGRFGIHPLLSLSGESVADQAPYLTCNLIICCEIAFCVSVGCA
jgi:hypothetical protein